MARAISDTAGDARMKLTCSHGGRLVHCGPDAAPHYVGGVTRVLAVPRSASFHGLAARLSSEMAGGAEVRALRHRLADDEEIIVSVTCDEELAHMVHEYDRLHAKRPHAAFRVFFFAAAHQLRRRSGLPPLPPTRMRRVQSDQALPLRARPHRWPAAYPAPVRRVQSAQEIAGSSYRLQPSFDQYQNCRGVR
ncbi:hypothetical protein PR202_ga13067 [Eleusine coracana subsp. coracana]|uniref:PB1 domain-containing protein n=1 Tax=Eleusine coracana subsp. coracana TaxID=191504 RepID=A0AAV5CD93_ELECO|nr:hypothetical protein PR202_ga13067 [Eleusine coracana subsp. coracana]